MPEHLALATCPVCGAVSQDLKINKNGNCYIYCDENNCKTVFGKKKSRELIQKYKGKGNNEEIKPAITRIGTGTNTTIGTTASVRTDIRRDTGRRTDGTNPEFDGRNDERAGIGCL